MSRTVKFLVVLVFLFMGIQAVVGLKLKFLNVVFRHGDRTPLESGTEVFPTNPYVNETFAPYGHGQLTNQGKQRVYDFGRYVRQQYSEFLGDIYHPEMIRARSSDKDRTKMSLQLAMAGAFPPSPGQQWNPSLHWQPVVTNYMPRPDVLVMPIECPQFAAELQKTLQLPEIREKEAQYSELMRNLTEWTGKSIVDTKNVAGIYSSLKALYFMGLELPEWTEGIFPEGLLSDAAVFHFRIGSYTKRLKTLNGGIMLKNFTDTMSSVISGEEPDLKMNFFGGHDYNIVSFLEIFDYNEPHGAQYSSAIFVELLEDDDHKHYVKVYYYKGIPADRVPVNIPGCGEVCPFDEFIKLFRDIFPTQEDIICPKDKIAKIF
ncbi:venom acid phosphatase Acph-1 [Diachasma alloeum]|uniref:venom acid phosphatase Acph-1 n=1 Tax=Diachasma alloeum TaxID=454923 RepID=UPI000738204E|nr:venom acid phosphatase Acph-1 [Diachasma alloeum]